ncbi:hypothetical protein [Radiobacillus deserti]|uniref:hypothetical protein n=1 Tax=Radiobacillus deserti TaxID=2594883 RepID=UPI00188ABDD6|nr:hypothetical protein [Radiobacillus deserti]
MEKRLRKTGLYGLLFGLAIAILFVDYKDVIPTSNGGQITTYRSVFEYIVSILRFGVTGSFIGLFIGWQYYKKQNETNKNKSYYIEFFIAVFLVALIVMLVFNG